MIDSLSCYDTRYFKRGSKVLDLGTGAGFPGIPLAIFDGNLKFTFFDSLAKRLRFLEELCEALDLKNVEFLHGRAEDKAHEKLYRSAFDIVTTRAVARLPVLTEWALPYVMKDGYFIALKDAQFETEIAESANALRILGGKIEEVRPVQLPGLDDKRAVIYIRKIAESPSLYPRKPKMATKEPL